MSDNNFIIKVKIFFRHSREINVWMFFLALSIFPIAACSRYSNFLPSMGASTSQINDIEANAYLENISLINITSDVIRVQNENSPVIDFNKKFPNKDNGELAVGAGDILEVSVWEAPPAMLFGSVFVDPRTGATTSRPTIFPEQTVSSDGKISVPFIGQVVVANLTVSEIEEKIKFDLRGKTNQVQVIVRLIKNNSSVVSVVGDVNSSILIPLSPKGERLLDSLAISGGVKQAVEKIMVQLSRSNETAMMPLSRIIRDPKQNIKLHAGDVVTILYQSQSFSVLGATGKNEEVPFEAQGIYLSQALARSGGLNDTKADSQGIYIFRFESRKIVNDLGKIVPVEKNIVPVVYQINLKEPQSLFLAQQFEMKNKDIVYVANSQSVEFEKFLNLLRLGTSNAIALQRLDN